MCGIWLALLTGDAKDSLNEIKLYKKFMAISHRGPDRSTFLKLSSPTTNAYIGFHRLSIMDPSTTGDQPFIYQSDNGSRSVYTICNGEIYNYKDLLVRHPTSFQIGIGL